MAIDLDKALHYVPGSQFGTAPAQARPSQNFGAAEMKVINSLKTAKKRDKNCRVVRRRGRVYVINKRNPRYKARQG